MFFKKILTIFVLLAFFVSPSWAVFVKESHVQILQKEIIRVNKLNKKGSVSPGQILKVHINGKYIGDHIVTSGESVYTISKEILIRGAKEGERRKEIQKKLSGIKNKITNESLTPSTDIKNLSEETVLDGQEKDTDTRPGFMELVKNKKIFGALQSFYDKLSDLQIMMIALFLSVIIHFLSFRKIREQGRTIDYLKARPR